MSISLPEKSGRFQVHIKGQDWNGSGRRSHDCHLQDLWRARCWARETILSRRCWLQATPSSTTLLAATPAIQMQLPVNKVLNKLRELYYRSDFVGATNAMSSDRCFWCSIQRGGKEELESMMNRIRDDIIAERVFGDATKPTEWSECSTTSSFNAFSGTGLKLGEPEQAEGWCASSSNRWETDERPIPLNEKNGVNCNEFYLKLHGKTVTYFAKKGENFTCLFSLLLSVGINMGLPADTSFDYILGYASSRANKPEFLEDWGARVAPMFLFLVSWVVVCSKQSRS